MIINYIIKLLLFFNLAQPVLSNVTGEPGRYI